MQCASRLPGHAKQPSVSSDSPSKLPVRRGRSGTVSASRPDLAGSSRGSGGEATGAGYGRAGPLDTQVEVWEEEEEEHGVRSRTASGRWSARVGSPETTTSSAGSPVQRTDEQRREAYQASFALRPLERETRPMSMVPNGRTHGGTRRVKKWLVLIIPPEVLPHAPPPLPVSGFANGYGPSERYSGGILLPLQPTLSAQVALIAREFALPSIAGVCLYLESGEFKPRLTDVSWQYLWEDFFRSDGEPRAMEGANGLPIAGRVDFDIDQLRARWLPGWQALPPATVESYHALAPRSPAFEEGAPHRRPRFGTSLSYNRPFTPASEAHVSELGTTDEEGETESQMEQAEDFGHHSLRERGVSPDEVPTSTPRADAARPRPLSLLSNNSRSQYDQSPRLQHFPSSVSLHSPGRQFDEPEEETLTPLVTSAPLLQAVSQPMALDDSGYEEEKGQGVSTPTRREMQRSETIGLADYSFSAAYPSEASITVHNDGTSFDFPRPPTPHQHVTPRPATPPNVVPPVHDLERTPSSDSGDTREVSGEDWTAQLDKLREASRTTLVAGLEHPSQYGSFAFPDGSMDELLRHVVGEEVEESPETARDAESDVAEAEVEPVKVEAGSRAFELDYKSGLYPPRGLYSQAQPTIVYPSPGSPAPSSSRLSSVLASLDTVPPAKPLSPVLFPSAPGYPYNLSWIFPSRLWPFRLAKFLPNVRVPPRLLFDLSPVLPQAYPFISPYPPSYPHLSPYPPVPANHPPSSPSARRSPRPPPIFLAEQPAAFHAGVDSWPPTPPSPERQPSPSLAERLVYSGALDGEFVEQFPLTHEPAVKGITVSSRYGRPASLVEVDYEMATNGMRSLQEVSEISPPMEEEGEGKATNGIEGVEEESLDPTLVGEDPFGPAEPQARSAWLDEEEEDEDDEVTDDDILDSYGGTPLSAILEESETEHTSASILHAGPVGEGGFFGDLAGSSDVEEESEQHSASPPEVGLEETHHVDGPLQVRASPFLPTFDSPGLPKIIYSAATASPSSPASRYSSTPPQSPDGHFASPLPSPTIVPNRAAAAAAAAAGRPSSPTPPPFPGYEPGSPPPHHHDDQAADTDDFTLEIDTTRASEFDPTTTETGGGGSDIEESYVLSPGLQEALGLDDEAEYAPVRFGTDELDSDGSVSEDGSQYGNGGLADESCQTFDHLSPLPVPAPLPANATVPPNPVLFTFPPTTESRDFVDAIAQFVCEAQSQSLERRGKFVVALSGHEPLPDLLSQALLEDDRVEWDKWEIFFTDDAIAPPGSPSSTYSSYARFFSLLPIPSSRIHVVNADLLSSGASPAQVAESVTVDMEEQLARAFPGVVGGPPRFDLILLGLGEDGSCAALHPGDSVLTEQHFLLSPVRAAPSPSSGALPSASRLTFTPPFLCAARRLAFLTLSSTHKTSALANMLDLNLPASSDEKVPAGRIVLGTGQPVIVFADEGAVEGVSYPRTRFWDGEGEGEEEMVGEGEGENGVVA